MMKSKNAISRNSIIRANTMSEHRVKSALKLAKKYSEDPQNAERLKDSQCKACFYSVRMAGRAFTNKDCGICEISMTFPTTDTDCLCESCSNTNGLCKHCGGDVDGVLKPEPYPFESLEN